MSKRAFLITPLASLVIVAGVLIGSFSAHAQTATGPQFLITWKANNSDVPSSYVGKALPSYGSTVTAEVQLISNGRPADISDQTIYWYLDDTLLGGGVGAQKVTFSPFGTPPNILDLKVTIPSYYGAYLTHTIELPLVAPVVVIDAPYPSGQFASNPVTVMALPYYFAASPSDLSYSWAVNGQAGSSAENPESAQITLPQGTPSGTNITISLSVKNSTNSESASTQSTLTYSSQL